MAKRLHVNQLRGGEGQSLIARKFEAIGLPFFPFTGGYDVGIDAMIELRDPATGTMSNTHIGVQCKATRTLQNERDGGFDYRFSQDDLDYWSGGTTPVVLCVAHLGSNDVWWVPVKKRLAEPATQASRLIRFDKQADLLDESAVPALLGLAQAAGSGTYMRPPPRKEQLHSNLLEVTQLPPSVWRAETEYRSRSDAWDMLKQSPDRVPSEWFLHGGGIYATHDLRDPPWSSVCDVGTVESFDPAEWSRSNDPEDRRRFVRLLNQCLRAKLGLLRMWFAYEDGRDYFYFAPSEDLRPRRVPYRSRHKATSRIVFQAYQRKDDPQRVAYYRSVGFERSFERLDGRWYLRINPTYRYTRDGKELDCFREERLAGMKKIERNRAVSGSVVMFAAILTARDLFAVDYPLLQFGDLLRVEVDASIPDALWARTDELLPPGADNAETDEPNHADDAPTLFDGLGDNDVDADAEGET